MIKICILPTIFIEDKFAIPFAYMFAAGLIQTSGTAKKTSIQNDELFS